MPRTDTGALLEDVADRLRQAVHELRDQASRDTTVGALDRHTYKAQGVLLALSYVEEAIGAR